MDKDVTSTILHLSLGDRVALMRFMHLISEDDSEIVSHWETEEPEPAPAELSR